MPFWILACCEFVSCFAFSVMATGIVLRWSRRKDRLELNQNLEDLRSVR